MATRFSQQHYTEEDLADEGFRYLGRNVRIASNCNIIGAENISIGDNVRIDGFCTLVAVGGTGLVLGSYIHIGGYCALLASEGVVMEDFTTLSWGVRLFTRSDDFSGRHMTNPTVPAQYTGATKGSIILKKHVIVGANSVILPRVTIDVGAAVGALSLVTRNLSEWGIYSGNPAIRIKDRKRNILELEKSLHDKPDYR